MVTDKQILVLAEDPLVRHTKQLVLEHIGFTVIGVGTTREVEYACSRTPFNLAILGRTVREPVKLEAAAIIRSKAPKTPILEICNQSPSISSPDYVLYSPEPDELAEKVRAIALKDNL